jgi:hypothetical protein
MSYSRTPLGGIVKKINDSTGVCEDLVDSNGESLSDVLLTPPQVAATQALVSGGGIGRAKRGASQHRAGKPWLRLPSAASHVGTGAGITHGGSATGAFTTRNGRLCYEITSPANASLQSMFFAITSGTVTNKQHIVFEVEDAEQWRGGSWRLGFYTDSGFTAGVRATITADSYNGYNGVHCLSPLSNEWANVGAGSFSSTMTQCIFQFQRKTGATGDTKLWVYEIAEAEKNSLPQIVIGADDGAETWYTDGLPICEKYGFSSYLAFIADDRGTATRMSQAEWADAVARGHHAVVHGCKTGKSSLADYFSDTAGYPTASAAITADIQYNRDIMVAEALDPDGLGRTVYVLPQGKHQPDLNTAGNLTVANALDSLGFVGGRLARVQNGIIANGGWSGAADYLPIIGHTWSSGDEAGNVAAIIASMQDEVAAGRSVVIMFHEVRASPSANEHITAANLEAIVSAAATLVRAGSARAGRLTDLVYEIGSYTSPVHVGT